MQTCDVYHARGLKCTENRARDGLSSTIQAYHDATPKARPGALPFDLARRPVTQGKPLPSDFVGTQVGQDISKLNWGGWNVHIGTTAGYMSSRATSSTGSTDIEVPFFGLYAVATKGRFFADIMVRNEFYNGRVTNQAIGLFNQQLGARGVSVSTSAGYNFALANNWFIEPSAGFIWSRTNVDNVNVSGGLISQGAGSILRQIRSKARSAVSACVAVPPSRRAT